MKKVWVEFDTNTGRAMRIFKNQKQSVLYGSIFDMNASEIEPRPKKAAVLDIRQQVFSRSAGKCELCAAPITWNSFHMHEKIHRGQFVDGKSGEVSLVNNSAAICYRCHKDAHSDREPKFGVRKADKEEV